MPMARVRVRPIALLVCLGLAVAGCAPRDAGEAAREALEEALEAGDRAAALRALEALRASEPETPELLAELGRGTLRAGEAPQALWLLEDAVERYPRSHELKLSLASVALLTNHASLALRALAPLKPDSEQHPAALIARVQAHLELGNLEGAMSLLEQAERLYPERPEARFARIAALVSERRLDEARELAEATTAGAPSQAARWSYERLLAAIHAAHGDAAGARAVLEPAVVGEPGDALVWMAFTRLCLRSGQLEAARRSLEAALEERPNDTVLYSLLGEVYAYAGQAEQAEQALLAFLEPAGSPGAYLALARFYARTARSGRAAELLQQASERFPADPALRLVRAEALLAADRVEEARAEAERYRELVPRGHPSRDYLEARFAIADGNPAAAAELLEQGMPRFDTARAQFWLGYALEARGDYLGAERRYRLALLRDGAQTAPILGLLRLAERRGDWREAAGYARDYATRVPDDGEGYRAEVRALLQLGEARRAQAVAREYAGRAPDAVEPQVLIGRSQRIAGQLEAASKTLEMAVARFGRSSELDAERAFVLGVAGRAEAALALVEGALEADPTNTALHLSLAALAFENGEPERGSRAVDAALELTPDDPRPLALRASYLASIGALDDARRDLERYLHARPQDANAHFELGEVCAREGKTECAIEAYRRAVELDASHLAAHYQLALAYREAERDAEARRVLEALRGRISESHPLDAPAGEVLRSLE